MPTYTYTCIDCGTFDQHQSIHDEPITNCPTCNGDIKKVFASAAIKFKGKGFYSTDSRGK